MKIAENRIFERGETLGDFCNFNSRAPKIYELFRKFSESSRLSGVFIINISGLTTHPGPGGRSSDFSEKRLTG